MGSPKHGYIYSTRTSTVYVRVAAQTYYLCTGAFLYALLRYSLLLISNKFCNGSGQCGNVTALEGPLIPGISTPGMAHFPFVDKFVILPLVNSQILAISQVIISPLLTPS